MKSDNYYGMINDIKEEPELLAKLFENRAEITKEFVNLFRTRDIQRVYLTGSGSPLYAANVLKYAAIKLLDVDATSMPAVLFNRHERFNTRAFKPEQMLLICPAESGRAKGQVEAERAAKRLGIPVVCTTWNADGLLAQESDIVLLKLAREKGMPTTKGQVMAIFLLLLCFIETAKEIGTITQQEYDQYMTAMSHVPENIRATIDMTMQWFDEHQDLVMGSPCYRIIAYGANIGTAEEAALKFTETHTRPSMFYELEDSMHGPVRAVKQGDMLMLLCAEEGAEKQRTIEFYHVMKKYSNACILVQSSEDQELDPQGLKIKTDNVEFVNSMEFVVAMQVLAFMIADHLGMDTGIHEPFAMMRELETSYK